MGRAPDIYDGTKTHTPNPDLWLCLCFWQSKVNGTVVELRLPLGPALHSLSLQAQVPRIIVMWRKPVAAVAG